jgi:metallophosphoesterase superfamily enzyme
MGHEHPSISLGDGIRSAKFPCFMVSKTVLLLPAFSLWAAGADVRAHDFLSPLAQNARFSRAIAICGSKLLPVNLT